VEAEEKTFGKDEVIFREGEPSANAYMVVQGHVELTKRGTHGPVLVGLAGPLDFFGETTLFGDTPYDVTARAAEKSRIRVVTRPMLVEWLNTEQGAATRIGTMLAERLRNVHHLILDQSEKQISKAGGGAAAVGFWSLLKKWLKRRRTDKQEEQGKKFLIGIATVNNDVDGAWTRALAGLLDPEAELAIRILPGALQIEPGADQQQAAAAAARAKDVLAKESDLDLLIWGDVHADGYSLWFSPQGKIEDERPGGFNLFTSLELPGDQEPPAGDVLAATLLAALEPPEARRFDQAQMLRYVVGRLENVMAALPMSWNLEQQRTALACYGNALATLAAVDPTGPFAHQAVDAYRGALGRVAPEERGMDEAQLHKHLGILMAAQAERTGDPAWLDLAVAEFRAGSECLARSRYPQEWGGLQNRLGLALYRLDLMGGGGPDLLKEALVAFQGALQAFPRQESPERWAEVMHNLAQVLQLYGDQMKSPDVLERAIETARAAIELRPRAKMPLAWASSQNTLGTALFMLAKHSKGSVPLEEATEAINGALEVYRQLGAVRQAEVTEKNLAHLTKLAKRRMAATPAPSSSHWFEQDK
jgi:tetratricopeptide (TPR) repeat protein